MSGGTAIGLPPGRTWVAPAAGFGAVLGLVVAAALIFQVVYADRIVAGVRVLGLDLGGQSPDAGRALLEGSAVQLTQQMVTLHGGGREWQLTAAELGMRVDADTMVQQAYEIGPEANNGHLAAPFPIPTGSAVLEAFNGGDAELGIHGNNEPAALGLDVTHGCIRMSNSAIASLVDVLPLGTPVTIQP